MKRAAVLALAVLALAGCSGGPAGFQKASVLQQDVRKVLDKRLASKDPGVTVKSVSCIEQSKTSATCLVKTSDGQSDSMSLAISSSGNEWISK